MDIYFVQFGTTDILCAEIEKTREKEQMWKCDNDHDTHHSCCAHAGQNSK